MKGAIQTEKKWQWFWSRVEFVTFLELKNVWLWRRFQQGDQREVSWEEQPPGCSMQGLVGTDKRFVFYSQRHRGHWRVLQGWVRWLQRLLLRLLCREVNGKRQEGNRGEQLGCYCNSPGPTRWWLGPGRWWWRPRKVNEDMICSESRAHRTCWWTGRVNNQQEDSWVLQAAIQKIPASPRQYMSQPRQRSSMECSLGLPLGSR